MEKQNFLSLGLIILLIVGIVFISGCVEDESPIKAPENLVSKASPETQPKASTELNLKIGETAKTSDMEVTVIATEKEKFYQYYFEIMQKYDTKVAPLGNDFVLADVEIKNIGSGNLFVGSSEFSAADSEGYRYDPELYYGDDGLEMLQELYPNQKIKGKIVFKIPEDASGLKINYDFGNIFSGIKLASWTIE